jgi:nucleotide-binding universal stress UspA family protein
MFKKIVVTLDGSKLAEVALPYAEELAAKMGQDIVLLTVLETEGSDEYKSRFRYVDKIADITKHHIKKYIENNKGEAVNVEIVTRTGDPAEGITKYAFVSGSPLIVMASHGRSGIGRWAVGSVADKVVRSNYNQPVMLIRANKSHSDMREKRIIKKALVTLDGSDASEMVIPYISQIASNLKMELTFLRVVPKTNQTDPAEIEAYLQKICGRFKDKNIAVNYKINTGDVAENIINFADELAFDLVAMSTRGMSRGNILSMGSVAQKVFLGGNVPLLLTKKYRQLTYRNKLR